MSLNVIFYLINILKTVLIIRVNLNSPCNNNRNMNELNGPFVMIVVGIREGRGFDFLQRPLHIEASLKGNKIEADPAMPDANPSVCTELVWETEKKEVRKLRSSHVPLRIDCYTLDEEQHREKIGFILLSLRSAQAISNNKLSLVEYKWHKLVSVPSEYKVCHPELALTFTVRDKIRHDDMMILNQMYSSIESLSFDETEKNVMPIKYLEDGFIQIGSNSVTNQKFTLSFLLKTANNLDLLLDKEFVFNPSNDKCYLALTVLGLTINTKYFTKHLHEPLVLNDRIMFKLLTNLEVLKLFINDFNSIPIQLYCGSKVIGYTDIDLKNFFDNEQLEKGFSCRLEQICEFTQDEMIFSSAATSRVPTISTEIWLEIQDVHQNSKMSIYTSEKSEDDSPEACGDQIIENKSNFEGPRQITLAMEDAAVQTTPRETKITKASSTMLKTEKTPSKVSAFLSNIESYHLFCLTIVFRSITWRKQLNINGFQFKFHHPKAHHVLVINCDVSQISPNEIIYLEDVYCKIYFLSNPGNINNLVTLYPPSVSLQNFNDQNIVDDFILYTKLLTKQEENNCDYFVVLNSVGDKEDLMCDLQVSLTLNEMSTNFTTDYDESEYNLDPIILDDWLAIKTVKDLNDWKETQENLFRDNLKVLESEKLELLQAEWDLKRIELETKLQQGLDRCKVLSEELFDSANDLKVKKKALDERLTIAPESREEIEQRVRQMMQEEFQRERQKFEAERKKLMDIIEEMKRDRVTIEEIIHERDNELEDMKKTTLTRDQTACLLQELRHLDEKFQQAQLEKSFFKEQWGNALKEVHALKSEDQRQIQQDIRRMKDELSQLSLDAVEIDRNNCEFFEMEDFMF